MILMPQIFDVTANENARYKRNELEYGVINSKKLFVYEVEVDEVCFKEKMIIVPILARVITYLILVIYTDGRIRVDKEHILNII